MTGPADRPPAAPPATPPPAAQPQGAPAAPPPAAPPPATLPQPMPASLAETLILAGALAILVLTGLLTGLLMNSYGSSQVELLLAGLLVLVIYVRRTRSGVAWPIPYATVLATVAAGSALLAVYALAGDILRYRNIDLGNLLGRAGFYGGVLLIVFGAYQIWLQRDRLPTA